MSDDTGIGRVKLKIDATPNVIIDYMLNDGGAPAGLLIKYGRDIVFEPPDPAPNPQPQHGKDSWRFQEAGADAVVLVGPESLALMKKIVEEPAPGEIEALVQGFDVVIREGFKHDALNRIEVFRSGVSGRKPLCATDRSFLALVSDRPFDVAVPRFDWNDAAAVADFIATKL